MVIYRGQVRGGFPGLVIAGGTFILPSALMMCALAWAYLRYGALPQIAGVLWGVKPVVVVLIAQAVGSLGKKVLKSRGLAVIAAIGSGLAGMHGVGLPLRVGTGGGGVVGVAVWQLCAGVGWICLCAAL